MRDLDWSDVEADAAEMERQQAEWEAETTTIAVHPRYGTSSDVEMWVGGQNRVIVGGTWHWPGYGWQWASVPADEVTVQVQR